jgi:hypothetical protein|tara:strand:+ start:215 stop:442 length:228 start_codon:yes stop_codon:yes gene_type:complete
MWISGGEVYLQRDTNRYLYNQAKMEETSSLFYFANTRRNYMNDPVDWLIEKTLGIIAIMISGLFFLWLLVKLIGG